MAKTAKRATDETLAVKYPHYVKGSVSFDAKAIKQRAKAICTCGKTYTCFTSDLFQLTACPDCREKARADRKAAKKAETTTAVAQLTAEPKEVEVKA